jgi:hypothetical protein
MLKYSYIVIAFYMLASGCKQSEIFPIVPSIEFESVRFETDLQNETDTLIVAVFSYRDGDGDIGLNSSDTFPPFNSVLNANNAETNPFHFNLHIDYLTLQNGEYRHVLKPNTNDTLRFQARMQNITPEGKHKAIRGEFTWKNSIPRIEGLSRSIKLRIKIYDRALHQSNLAESPVIVLP